MPHSLLEHPTDGEPRLSTPLPALWASSAPVGEADALVRCFTTPLGEVSLLARGLRKAKSKLAAVFKPGDELKLTTARSRGRGSVLTGASLHLEHAAWRADLRLLTLYWYFIECACLGSAGHSQNEQVYTLVVNLLRATPATPGAQAGALSAFCLKLLGVHGLAPELGYCCVDGHALEPGEPVHLLPSGEGLIGRSAYNARYARSAAGLVRLDAERLARWRRLYGGPLLEFAQAGADSADAALLLNICTQRLADLAARPVRSGEFLARQWGLPSAAELAAG